MNDRRPSEPPTPHTGTVTWFSAARGFGFIEPDDVPGGAMVLFHITALEGSGYRTLWVGCHVEFDMVEVEKGLKAVRVRPLAAERRA